MNFLESLPKPFFALAPMYEVTDTVFRQTILATAAPNLMFTEFTNVDGIQSPGRTKMLDRLRFVASEKSLVAQIWGLGPENFYKTAREIVDGTLAREMGLPDGCNYVGIDLNFCCPAKSEVKAGACTALANNRPLAAEIIQATKRGANGQLPVSVKARIGFSTIDLTWLEFLLGQKLDMLTVECRTRKEMSKVPAHWDILAEVIKMRDEISPHTKIVGNGDIMNRRHGMELASKYRLDGIMIGRGIFHDPFAFAADSPWKNVGREQRLQLYKQQVELFAKTWQEGERNIKTLNKFCKVYVSDFDGAKEMREQFMEATSIRHLLELINGSLI